MYTDVYRRLTSPYVGTKTTKKHFLLYFNRNMFPANLVQATFQQVRNLNTVKL